jgi:hypothetical protein
MGEDASPGAAGNLFFNRAHALFFPKDDNDASLWRYE